MQRRFNVILLAASIVALFMSLVAFKPQTVQASVSGIVISQLYTGGGSASAVWAYDYIELFNAGSSPVPIDGWSVQYQSSTGATWNISTTVGTATINPGKYFLVQTGNTLGGAALPTPDAIGADGVRLSATQGKVALVNNGTALSCTSNATCFPSATIVDLIGYGTNTNAVYEGSGAAPGSPGTANSLFRASNGCVDTDNNASDFSLAAASPRNSATAANVCGGGGPTNTPTPTGSATATPTATATATNTPPVAACLPATVRIHDIQGAAHISPLNGTSVSAVPGIVTVVKSNGFWIQEPDACIDSNIATSEGVFVFTSTAPTVTVGNLVTVNATVSEFRPAPVDLTITELTSPSVTVVTPLVALPSYTIIGAGGRVPPTTIIDNDATGDVETSGTFDAATDGIDFYESLEGMLVQMNNPLAVGPRTSFGEIAILPDGGTNPGVGLMTARGGILVQANDFNPEFVIIDDALAGVTTPNVNPGATFTAPMYGVMDYAFDYYKFLVTTTPVIASNPLQREVTTLIGTSTKLTIATFNVENLSPNDSTTKFNALADYIVNRVKSPDIITIEEIQDNNGTTNDSVVDASTTFNMLISAIATAGGPTYQYRQINPVDDQDGGAPGGNIRQGFLFNASRVTFVDRGTCGSTTATTVTNSSGFPLLSCSPGRIAPSDSAWSTSRKPLVGEFTFNGQTVFVVGNHFNSKGGDDPLYGHDQPPVRSSETQRHNQATLEQSFLAQITAIDPNANIVVLGDINDFQFSQTVTLLKGTNMVNAFDLLPANEQYSYVFNGNSQVLDQILFSNNIFNNKSPEYDVVHVNSEFFDQISDHDPAVARFDFGVPATATNTNTATFTPSITITVSPTSTPTNTATSTPSNTATFTPSNTATNTPTRTNTPTNTATNTATNTPVPPRPDTIGVYKAGIFYLRNTNNTGAADINPVFGGDPTDLPVAGDWNGDGVDTIGVYRSSTGFFYLSDSNTSPALNYNPIFGNPGDTPFAGKWTADMTHDGIGVYRNSNGILYQRKALTGGFDDFFAVFGNPGDQGFAGDWDANGFDSIGVYRSSNQMWYLTNNSTPSGITFSDINFVLDITVDSPVVGDWDGDGDSTPGWLTASGVFSLHPNNSIVGPDNVFAFGPANSRPIAGKWIAGSKPPLAGNVVNPPSGGGANPVDGSNTD